MPDPRTDPLDALRAPVTPYTPDPAFAADLRDRLVRALLAPRPEEPSMATDLTTRPRHGSRHGDVSSISLGLPDLARGRAFYGSVLGWRFSPDRDGDSAEVEDIVPMTRLLPGTREPNGARGQGAVLGFRVDAIDAAVAAVRAHGGTITDPHPTPSAPAAEGRDDQGVPFSLHEMPTTADIPGRGEFSNGEVQGDVSYLTMVVPDVEAAHAFYGGVLGWSFNIGRAGGAQVSGVAPQIGMTTRPESGPATPGVILCYRVDDIEAAVARVRDVGGRAREVADRPYGRESLCADDQGTPFYLHQF
jgi:predicted enzyme related to lactoylglutathione lyase